MMYRAASNAIVALNASNTNDIMRSRELHFLYGSGGMELEECAPLNLVLAQLGYVSVGSGFGDSVIRLVG